MTFLKMMENAKAQGAPDLTHEFDPIDAKQVIRIVIDQSGVHVEPEHAMAPPEGGQEHELPDEMAALRGGPEGGQEMPPEMPPGMSPGMDPGGPPHEEPDGDEAPDAPGAKAPPFAKKPKKDAKPPKKDEGEDEEDEEKDSPKAAAFRDMRMRKLAGILDDQYRQAEWAFEDLSTRLASSFRRAHPPSFDEFEKSALAECGDEVGVQILNVVRNDCRMSSLDVPQALEKAAALATHHVSEETQELALFETLVKTAKEAARLRKGLDWINARCA
jgi:hypothetical protein